MQEVKGIRKKSINRDWPEKMEWNKNAIEWKVKKTKQLRQYGTKTRNPKKVNENRLNLTDPSRVNQRKNLGARKNGWTETGEKGNPGGRCRPGPLRVEGERTAVVAVLELRRAGRLVRNRIERCHELGRSSRTLVRDDWRRRHRQHRMLTKSKKSKHVLVELINKYNHVDIQRQVFWLENSGTRSSSWNNWLH